MKCLKCRYKSRPKLSTIVTYCISMSLEIIDSYYIIENAGYKLSPFNKIHRAYSELLQDYNYGDIKLCNEHLESLGIDKKYFLGTNK